MLRSLIYHLWNAIRGQHECEIFEAGSLEEGSRGKWEECKKIGGHEKFIPVKEFHVDQLPWPLSPEGRQWFGAAVDLTVRLRVHWTSLNRLECDQLSEYRGTDALRLGTGYVLNISKPVVNESCVCDECGGWVVRKHWTFWVHTAQHVVWDTEEARETLVDLFYDDESSHTDGRMKSLWAKRVDWSQPDQSCLLCVTHDEEIGERLESLGNSLGESFASLENRRASLFDFNELSLPNLSRYLFTPTQHSLAVCVSHPHGQPKKISVGKVRATEETLGDSTYCFHYNTATCPGSSGAPVFSFYILPRDPKSPAQQTVEGRPKRLVHNGAYKSSFLNNLREYTNYGNNNILFY